MKDRKKLKLVSPPHRGKKPVHWKPLSQEKKPPQSGRGAPLANAALRLTAKVRSLLLAILQDLGDELSTSKTESHIIKVISRRTIRWNKAYESIRVCFFLEGNLALECPPALCQRWAVHHAIRQLLARGVIGRIDHGSYHYYAINPLILQYALDRFYERVNTIGSPENNLKGKYKRDLLRLYEELDGVCAGLKHQLRHFRFNEVLIPV